MRCGLRKYEDLPPLIWNGIEGCEHEWGIVKGDNKQRSEEERLRNVERAKSKGYNVGGWGANEHASKHIQRSHTVDSQFCRLCGAWRGDLGLEPTPELYLDHMMLVMAEVWRVLRDDGVCFVNIGDSYASIGRSARKESPGIGATQAMDAVKRDVRWQAGGGSNFNWSLPGNIKSKSLCLIPQKLAIRCQEAGWIIRSEIIWAKLNPMPESCKDRPTRSHEQVWMMTKQGKYYWDQASVREKSPSRSTGRADSTFLGCTTLGPKFSATIFTDNGSSVGWGRGNFVSSELSVYNSMTRDAIRYEVFKFIGLQIRIETSMGDYVMDLKDAAFRSTPLTSEIISFLGQLPLDGPVLSLISNSTAPPCGAIAAGPVDRTPFSATGFRAKIVGFPKVFLIPGKFFAAEITLSVNKSWSTLFVFTSLWSSHVKHYPKNSKLCQGEDLRITGPDGTANDTSWNNNPSGHMGTHSHGRNVRSVWHIATEPTPEAHFATWPSKLVNRMIRAATKPGDVVLDPFGGTCKSVIEAERLNRTGIGLDLSYTYLSEIAKPRQDVPLQRVLM